jgi:flagellar motor switch protein FliN
MIDDAADKPSPLFPEFPASEESSLQPAASRARLGEIPVEVQVVIGRAKVSVAQLAATKQGSWFRLDKRFGEPVEIQVNGKTIGHGEIVSDDRDNFVGIRMTSVENRL